MPLSLTFNYTSITPNAIQNTPENSMGGYISTNNVYDVASITSSLDEVSEIIPVSVLPIEISGLSLIDIEVIKYSSVDTGNTRLTNVSRGVVPNISSKGFPHSDQETIRYLTVSNLFNPKFNNNYTQYRCIAIKNTSSMSVTGVKPIIINDNTSDTIIDVGIEVPLHDYRTGIITDALSGVMFVDSNLSGLFSDNFFNDSLIRITSGTSSGNYAIITSYDDATGTIVVDSDLGSIVSGNTFEIEPSPSQSVINQLTSPINNGRFFGFLNDGGAEELSYNNIRENTDNFNPNDIFYLWIKRSIEKNVRSGSDTAAVILIQYTHSGS